MEVIVKGEKRELKELGYMDVMRAEEVRQKDGLVAQMKHILITSGLTDEEVESLSFKEGIEVQKVIVEAQDFQKPPKKE